MSPSSRRRSRSLVASSSRVWLASLRAVRSRGAGHRLDQVLPPLAHPVGRLPALVKLVQHLGEGSLGPAFRLRAILEDGQNGEIHRLALPHQQVRCKAIFVYIVFEFLQLRRQPLPVAAGAEGQLPRHQRRQAR